MICQFRGQCNFCRTCDHQLTLSTILYFQPVIVFSFLVKRFFFLFSSIFHTQCYILTWCWWNAKTIFICRIIIGCLRSRGTSTRSYYTLLDAQADHSSYTAMSNLSLHEQDNMNSMKCVWYKETSSHFNLPFSLHVTPV